MKKTLFLPLFSIFLIVGTGFVKVENLHTEYLRNPVGIDVRNPRFSWQIASDERDVMQSAYQVTVYADEAKADVVWTSGKIQSDKSINIKYEGGSLKPSTRYHWVVDAWTSKGEAVSQETAFFETGLLDEGFGEAAWIKYPSPNFDSKTVSFTLDADVTVVNDNAGIIFSAKDANNMFLWSINTKNYDQPVLRRHVFVNGGHSAHDVMLGKHFSKADIIGKEMHLKIAVDGNNVKTYLNDILIDEYADGSGRLINGYVGVRAFNGDVYEDAYFDNIVLTTYAKEMDGNKKAVVSFSENFEGTEHQFEDGQIVTVNGNRKLHVFSKAGEFKVMQDGIEKLPIFRKTFAINKAIESVKVYCSGLGIYDLYINGKRVGTPAPDGDIVYDELKPGWTDFRKTVQYSSYDISPWVQRGDNAIGAIVSSGWWSGAIAQGRYGSPELGFIAKFVIKYADGTKDVLLTDTTWKAALSESYKRGSVYHGEMYDARKESDWTVAGYDDSAWKYATVNTDFKGEIIAFEGPPVRVRPEMQQMPISVTVYEGTVNDGSDFGAINALKTTAGGTITLQKGQTAIYDLGQNMVGWPKFTVNGKPGTKLKFRFGEMLNDSGKKSRGCDGPKGSVYTANLRSAKASLLYTLKGRSDETYHPLFTFFGFRYCEVTAMEDVVIKSLVGEVVGSVNEEGSRFRTNNAKVNKLYNNVIWGQRSNYVSIPTDCPQRDERLGWTGDTQIFCRAGAYNSDVAAFFHKWMRDMRDSQDEHGAYPNVAPVAWSGWGNGAWAEAGIIVPWTIYLMYDDLGIIEENYVSMEKYMQFLSNRADDQYKYNGADISFGDWLAYEHTDKRYISVAYYAYVAELMAKMSKVLSQKEGDIYARKAAEYETLYKNIKAEFQTRYVNNDGSLKQSSQTAYLLALKLDLFPDAASTRKAVNYLVKKIDDNGSKLSTGFVGTGTLNHTLSAIGANKTAYDLLLQEGNPSWLYSVDQGATTIWERWDSYTLERGFGDVGMNSFNHYAYGAVSEWMFRFMAGIEADEKYPGFKHIILQPTPDTFGENSSRDRITEVNASYQSYSGEIKSAWKIKPDGNIIYSATVPANTTATLYLPVLNTAAKILEQNKPVSDVKEIMFKGIENNKAVLELKSGSYFFEVK